MHVKPRFACALAVILALACTSQVVHTQSTQSGRRARVLITRNIDDAKLVMLKGNVRPEANAINYRGAVPEDFAMEHMLMQLHRPPELEKELQQFIDDLHDPQSPSFHKWLTAQQFGNRFGVAQQDVDSVTRWLESFGFKVNSIYPSFTPFANPRVTTTSVACACFATLVRLSCAMRNRAVSCSAFKRTSFAARSKRTSKPVRSA